THGQQQNLIKPPHVAIVPTPGIGHLTPLVELAKLLLVHHNFTITFIIPNDGLHLAPQKKLLQALDPQAISYIFLPPVSFDDLPNDVMVEIKMVLTLTRSLSALRDELIVLIQSTRLVALVVDLFGTDAFDVANELHVSPYIFFTTAALSLSLIFHFPHLHETTTCEYRDLPEPIQLPGCVPLHGRDLTDPVQDRSNEAYKVMVRMCKKHRSAAGIMVNSFVDLEPGAFKAFKEQGQGLPPVYPVGPVIKMGSVDGFEGNECMKWLDKQPNESVLFVSFGSGGTFSQEQMTELALGLELSGQRFIWVVKSPNETAKNANYFSVQGSEDPLGTKEVGLVVPSWAPQVQVLSHRATGGFLTHCGWNSTLESIVHGVPLIAWPLYAEQRTNRALLVDGLKVAVVVKCNDKGIVESQDIAKYVRGLIEGDEGKLLRNNMKGYKEAAKLALSQEGSSTKSLAEVAQVWKSLNT
ncbi:UDP-Glycosyltransferase superfamily protein, partial [Prunus dulcis]